MPLRLIDSSVWIDYLRPSPDVRIVRAVRAALSAGEAAISVPIIIEILSGIRDEKEYAAREAEFRELEQVPVEGEVGFIAARIGEALAEKGKMGKTVDLMLAAATIRAGAELWSLRDEHYEDIQTLLKRGDVPVPGPFRIRWLP